MISIFASASDSVNADVGSPGLEYSLRALAISTNCCLPTKISMMSIAKISGGASSLLMPTELTDLVFPEIIWLDQ